MSVSISRRAFRSLNTLSSSFTALSNGLTNHNVSSLQPSARLGLSFIAGRRFYSTILSPGSSEEGFPADLLSRKTRANTPERTLGLYQDLVIPVTNFSNEDKGLMVLAGDVFDVPLRRDIVHRVVRWQLAKRQQGTHSTKTISEVSGTGRKPWNQKGTGRARFKTRRGAQARGGETKHGPKPRSHAHSLNKKVRRLGLKITLSAYAAEGKLLAFDDMDVSSNKTKNLAQYHKQMEECNKLLRVDGDKEERKKKKLLVEDGDMVESKKKKLKLLLVDEEISENLKLATQNLHYVNVLPIGGLNVRSILLHDTIAMSRAAINKIVERMHTPINRDGQGAKATLEC